MHAHATNLYHTCSYRSANWAGVWQYCTRMSETKELGSRTQFLTHQKPYCLAPVVVYISARTNLLASSNTRLSDTHFQSFTFNSRSYSHGLLCSSSYSPMRPPLLLFGEKRVCWLYSDDPILKARGYVTTKPDRSSIGKHRRPYMVWYNPHAWSACGRRARFQRNNRRPYAGHGLERNFWDREYLVHVHDLGVQRCKRVRILFALAQLYIFLMQFMNLLLHSPIALQ